MSLSWFTIIADFPPIDVQPPAPPPQQTTRRLPMVHDHCGFPTHERASQLHGPEAETELDSANMQSKYYRALPRFVEENADSVGLAAAAASTAVS